MKKFSFLHDQLIILHRRGLEFEDYSKAKKYILTNNYYNIINGYSKYFMNSIQAFNISNDENINSIPVSFLSTENSAIINMNNEQLEVEDLADKVTQAQIDEIKSHFDTKISSLDYSLKLHINESKQSTISELKDFISTENKSIKETKNSKFHFWVGSVIVPIGIALLTIYLTMTFGN